MKRASKKSTQIEKHCVRDMGKASLSVEKTDLGFRKRILGAGVGGGEAESLSGTL